MARWQARRSRFVRRVARGVLVLVVAGSLVSSTGAPVAAAPRPFNVTLVLTSDPGTMREGLVTDGAVVIWIDARGALVSRDLATGQERQLLPGPARRDQLALDNGVLVWSEHDASGAAIRGLHLGGGEPFTIAAGAGERNSPAIGGATVVWRDRRNGNWDIYGYDLETKRTFPIVTEGSNQGTVAIGGSLVVWEDHRTGHWNLRGYDLNERREFALTTGTDDCLNPVVGAGVVAFVRRPPSGGFGALVVRDVQSGKEQTIVNDHPVQHVALTGQTVIWEDWRDGVPNIYAFDRTTSQEFALTRSEQARDPVAAGNVVVWLSKGQFTSRVTAVRLERPLPSDPQDPPTVSDPNVRYFPETKHTLSGAFKNFWAGHGDLALFGFPLTEPFEETDAQGVKRQVQYFERARLEADPQDPTKITVGRLGAELTRGQTFPTVTSFANTADRVYFPQTGHSLGGGFKTFWESRGGVAAFGYPISEEFQENGQTVQYFERARFEYHPSAPPDRQVTLGQLGRDALVARGWLPGPPVNRRER